MYYEKQTAGSADAAAGAASSQDSASDYCLGVHSSSITAGPQDTETERQLTHTRAAARRLQGERVSSQGKVETLLEIRTRTEQCGGEASPLNTRMVQTSTSINAVSNIRQRGDRGCDKT